MNHNKSAASGKRSGLLPAFTAFLLFAVAFSCVERFEPQQQNYQSVLVVEGHISNLDEPYVIRLSTTQPINSPGYSPVTGASVVIIDAEGGEFPFFEASSGIYQSNPANFTGNIGEIYQLDIRTADGRHYRSEEVLLKESPPIDSVYYQKDRRLNDEGIALDGVRILVDAHDATGNTRYYRYEWIETYQIKVPYPSPYNYYPANPAEPFVPVEVFAQICYASENSSRIMTTNTRQLEEDRVSQFELNFVNTTGYKLRSLYSILVRQYAIDEAGYKYWSELQKGSENLGTLFDPLPYELRGNVQNVDDPEEVVLGYFEASGAVEKRIYINRDELMDLGYPPDGCAPQLAEAEFSAIPGFLNAGFLIAFLGPYPVSYAVMAPGPCADCRYHGSIEKPDFWPL